MSLARYAVFRLGLGIPVLLGILALTFLLTHVLPTNPAVQAAGPLATKASILQKEHVLGVGVAVLSADRVRGVRNLTARTYGTIGTAIPDFFLALVLILVFYTTL